MAHSEARGDGPSTASKLQKEDPDFIQEAMSMTTDQLKDKIVVLTRHEGEINAAKKDDVDLQRLQEQLKTAKETYSVPLKAIKLKVKYLIETLDSKGK